MIRVSLASRSNAQLDRLEKDLRLLYVVAGPAETVPRAGRRGKHRRHLTVLMSDPGTALDPAPPTEEP